MRGITSINGRTIPLSVIDNVSLGSDDFNALNPNDTESISVLKDTPATSMHGSRGANGVIMVTTKKERVGKTQFNIKV